MLKVYTQIKEDKGDVSQSVWVYDEDDKEVEDVVAVDWVGEGLAKLTIERTVEVDHKILEPGQLPPQVDPADALYSLVKRASEHRSLGKSWIREAHIALRVWESKAWNYK